MINKNLKILFSFALIMCNFLLLTCSNDNTSIIMVVASSLMKLFKKNMKNQIITINSTLAMEVL